MTEAAIIKTIYAIDVGVIIERFILIYVVYILKNVYFF
jgi:hypothetical protein